MRLAYTRCLLLLLTACAPTLALPEQVKVATSAERGRLVIIKSDANPVYDLPVTVVADGYDGEVKIYANAHDNESGVAEALKRDNPAVIFCLGHHALEIARRARPDTPTMFAMVANYEQYNLERYPDVFGVALEPAPAMDFSQFKMILPDLKRVLVFYNPKMTKSLAKTARDDLRNLGVELVGVELSDFSQLPRAYREHRGQLDAVWMLPDPVVFNRRAFTFLRDQTLADHLPLMASLSEHFAQLGALMAVEVDFSSVGSQASRMLHKFTMGQGKTAALGVERPIGGKLAVNLSTAKALGIQISDDVYSFIGALYR